MKKKYLFVLLSILMVTISLVGCGKKEPEPTESVETTEAIENSTESEDSNSTESEIVDNLVEHIVVVDSIDENGILCYPYKDTSDLWDVDEKFYINSKDVSIYKNGKTSIYDIVYFYDGLVITYDGSYETKSEYSIIQPKEGSKIIINLLEEYKSLNLQDKDNRDETPVDIIDKDENKADIVFSGMFCKFNYPAKYKDCLIVADNSGWSNNLFIDVSYTYNDNGRNVTSKLFTISRIVKANGGSKYDDKVNYSTGFVMHETSNYIYEVTYNNRVDFGDVKQELVDYIIKTITVIE